LNGCFAVSVSAPGSNGPAEFSSSIGEGNA
jgi:hypothetical protein